MLKLPNQYVVGTGLGYLGGAIATFLVINAAWERFGGECALFFVSVSMMALGYVLVREWEDRPIPNPGDYRDPNTEV